MPRLVRPVNLYLDLKNSRGLAARVGLDVALNERWHLNTSIHWIDIDTEARFSSVLGRTIAVDDAEIDPLVYQINIGYRC